MGCDEHGCSTDKSDICGDDCDCSGDMLAMWHKAVEQAMIETKKDAIKAILREQFGEAIDESAKAVVKTMGVKFKAAIESEKAMGNLKKELGDIMSKNLKCDC